MARQLPILPGTPAQRVRDQISPYIPDTQPFLPEEQITRANQISVDIQDNIKPFSVGLQDIDEAVFYYFENVIQPTVIQNGNKIPVPISYASQERWAAVQSDGYYRDKNGKLMYPLIMIQRTGIEKNRTLANKLDGNNVNNFAVSKARYNQQNQYTPFGALNNWAPSEKFYLTPVPDYLNITYNCVVFTNFVQENNKIVEAIEFSSDSYWGDKNSFYFRTYITNFDSTAEYAMNDERIARTSMSITLYGYIVPDTYNRYMATNGKRQFFSKSTVSITNEVVANINNIRAGSL